MKPLHGPIIVVLAAALLGLAPPELPAAPGAASQPERVRPAGGVRGSRAFLAALDQVKPLDLRAAGYVEDEYLVEGHGYVYDWPTGDGPVKLARGRYVTRILVRRPKSAAHFSGTVIVEGLNPSTPVDLPIMWAHSYAQFIADGHAWVGVTVKPNTMSALRRFDPSRYGKLAMPHPRGGPACETANFNRWSQPTTPDVETGLAWDIISQVGALLKSSTPRNPLSRPAERLYLTGQSQTAGYARTYASAFARFVLGRDGRPLYDAFLYSGSPPWQVPLHQCAPDLAADDPRLTTPPAGVPVMEIFAEGDIGTNIVTRRADSDTAPDLFRRYEVAGAPHGDLWQQRSYPNAADQHRATTPAAAATPACLPANATPSDFPVRYVLNSAWRNLEAWVRDGVAPPRGVPLQRADRAQTPFDPATAFATDEHGNARGGIRSPAVEVPVARWIGAMSGSFNCMFRGYKYPLDRAELRRLYPTHASYVARVRETAAALRSQRWLTEADAAEIIAAAEAADTDSASPSGSVSPTMDCSAALKFARPGLTLDRVERVAAGHPPLADGSGAIDSAAPLVPEHCLVQGRVDPRIGHGGRPFAIGFDLRLPTQWNGRFAFHGGGGMDGRLVPAVGDIHRTLDPSALARGFAVISSDGGRRGAWTDSTFGQDQQARIDYAYNALEKITVLGKQFVTEFYGRPPDWSYHLGCSNGGRQGLVAAQKLPLLFDGIIAGDPSMGFSRIAVGEVWNIGVVAKISPRDLKGRPILARAFSDADLKRVRDAVLQRCDAHDGLVDNLIHDWQRCEFDPAELSCKGAKATDCLSTPQVNALRQLFQGPLTKSGRQVYGPFNYDTGIASASWRGMRLGTAPDGEANSADATLGLGQFRFYQLTPPDPGFDPLAPFDVDALLERSRYTAALGDGDSPYLETFVRRGKMIVYNGLADQGMASSEIIKWYEHAVAATGPAVRDSVRLYFVPGMTHCSGGEATDRFDMLTPLMEWVEHGRAPDRIVATSRSIPDIARPLCPHPLVARYQGGDPKSAASFACMK